MDDLQITVSTNNPYFVFPEKFSNKTDDEIMSFNTDEMDAQDFKYWCATLLCLSGYFDVAIMEEDISKYVDIVAAKELLSIDDEEIPIHDYFKCFPCGHEVSADDITCIKSATEDFSDSAIIISCNDVDTDIIRFAKKFKIKVWDRERILQMLKHRATAIISSGHRASKRNPIKVREIGSIDDYDNIEDFNKDYTLLQQEQAQWIEHEYDLSTIEGIESVPLDPPDVPGSYNGSFSGSVDRYLRYKGFQYEKEGKKELAIACLKRCNDIWFHQRGGHRKDDYYSFVRMLIHFREVELARIVKQEIDVFFGDNIDDDCDFTWQDSLDAMPNQFRDEQRQNYERQFEAWNDLIDFEIERANKYWEYQFVAEHLPDLCPKSQAAYTRAKHSNSKRFQEIVERMKQKGLSFPEPLK